MKRNLDGITRQNDGTYYVFGDEVGGESGEGGWHLVDGEANGMHGLLLLWLVITCFVVLCHRYDHMTLGTGSARNLNEELGIHRRRLCFQVRSIFSCWNGYIRNLCV